MVLLYDEHDYIHATYKGIGVWKAGFQDRFILNSMIPNLRITMLPALNSFAHYSLDILVETVMMIMIALLFWYSIKLKYLAHSNTLR